MSEWLEVAVPVSAASDAEAVAALLPDEVAAAGRGTELRDREVVFWIPVELAEEVLEETRRAARRLAGFGLAVVAAEVEARPALPEQEWREAWKRHFRVTRLTRQLVVVPSWERAAFSPGPEDRVLDLDPGQAFGTGAHASTRLCLELMQRARDEGLAVSRFLDVGCGSGILAIAAARLWPEARGEAIDNDPVAVKSAAENVSQNRAGARVRCATTAAGEVEGAFELVLANIQRDTLLELREDIAARVVPGGRLILSGLLTDQVEDVAARYAEHPGLAQSAILRSKTDPAWSAAELLGAAP